MTAGGTGVDDVHELPLPPSIYFGGCAFGAAFYIGVYEAMVERWGQDFYKRVLLGGGSVGCIFAIAIGLGLKPKELKRIYQGVAEKCVRHGAVHYGSVFMEECVREMLAHPLDFKRLEGRLCLGATYFFSRHRWHVSWVDNEDLVACVRRSCHIPFYCQRDDGLRGELVVDGAYGFSGTDLPHGDATLYVGIDPHAEITRTLENRQMMAPVVGEEFEAIVRSGYDQFMRWDGQLNRKVHHRLPNYQALYVLWTLKVVEFFWLHMWRLLGWLSTLPLTLLSLVFSFSPTNASATPSGATTPASSAAASCDEEPWTRWSKTPEKVPGLIVNIGLRRSGSASVGGGEAVPSTLR
eukprot:gene9843-7046_t